MCVRQTLLRLDPKCTTLPAHPASVHAPTDLYDLTRWGLRNSRSVNKIAASLSKLIEKMPRDQFYRLLDFHRMPQNGTASTVCGHARVAGTAGTVV